jgi:hypothetical protein
MNGVIAIVGRLWPRGNGPATIESATRWALIIVVCLSIVDRFVA